MPERASAAGAAPKACPGRSIALRELAALFMRLGATAFGGPAAHVALMEQEVVGRRRWLEREQFLDLVSAANLIPGPSSTELAIHIGHQRAGWAGLVVAGSCFIVPAALITVALAWAYVRFGALPETGWLLYGVKPVIIAVILQALVKLGGAALKTRPLAALGVACAVARLLGVHELAILLAAGALTAAVRLGAGGPGAGAAVPAADAGGAPAADPGAASAADPGAPPPTSAGAACFPLASAVPAGRLGVELKTSAGAACFPVADAAASAAAGAGAAAASVGLGPLFLFFVKVGSVLFGSGYVLLAFLRADLVERWGWLSEAQLLDAIAIGQVTPGPVFTTATFIGYLLAGIPGAAVATLGIFLPAFFFVAASGPVIPHLRRSRAASAFLDGVNAGSLALMAVVAWQLTRSALVDGLAAALAAASALLLFRYRVSSAWLVLGGALAGAAARGVR